MQIKKVSIEHFGKFRQSSVLESLKPGFNLIYGHNEAGKTTLFHLFTALLYGFYPANRADYPYVNRDVEQIQFEAAIVHQEKHYVVKRSLKSKPELEIFDGQFSQKLGNQSLGFVNHISKDIYEKVYALNIEALQMLEGKTWQEIQDKLLFNMGTQLLMSPHAIVTQLEQRSGELWRPTRRGNQRIRALDETLRGLRAQRHEAMKGYQKVRELEASIQTKLDQKVEFDRQIQFCDQEIKSARKWMPVWTLLETRRKLSLELLDLEHFSLPLKRDYEDQLGQLEESMDQLQRDIHLMDQEIGRLKTELNPLLAREKILLSHDHELQQLSKWSQNITYERERLDHLLLQKSELENDILYSARRFMMVESAEQAIRLLKGVDSGPLIGIMRRLKKEYEIRMDLIASRGVSEGKLKRPSLMIAVMGLVGLVGIYLGYRYQQPLISYGSAVLTGCILALGGMKFSRNNHSKGQSGKGTDEVFAKLLAQIKDLHASIAWIDEVLKQLTDDDLRQLDKLFEQLKKWDDLQLQIRTTDTRQDEAMMQIQQLNIIHGIASDDYASVVVQLHSRIDGLRRQDQENMLLIKEMEQKQQHRGLLQKNFDDKAATRSMYLNELEKIDSTSYHEACRRLHQHMDAVRELERVKRELDPLDLTEMPVDEIQSSDLERIERTRETLHHEQSDIKVELTKLEKDLERLKETVQLHDLDCQIKTVEMERQELAVQRDKMMVMASLIREAEERYRLKNQPDVLRKASEYLKHMTHGAYQQLFMDLKTGTPQLQVLQRSASQPVDFTGNFSKGTQHQVFLALRLALIDHLDKDHAKLPIFFDESLINWDPIRLEPTLDLLKELSRERQVFFFTCHDTLSRGIEQRLDVERIDLTA